MFPEWPGLRPSSPRPAPRRPGQAAAAATQAVVAAEGICARLDREPLTLVRAGTVAVRDLGRLARDLDLADEELALLVDLLVEAGVLAVGGPFGQRSLGLRPEADAWLSGRPSAAGPTWPPPGAPPTWPSRTTSSPAPGDAEVIHR